MADLNPNGQAPTMKVSICDANNPANILQPQFENAVAVTKSDSTVYNPPLSQLWVGGAGDVAVLTVGGQTVTFTAVTAGRLLPVRCTKVMSTNTTATNITGLY